MAIVLFEKGRRLRIDCRVLPVNVFSQYILLSRAQARKQPLCLIGFLLHDAIFVFGLLVVRKLKADQVIQGPETRFLIRQAQDTLLMSKIEGKFERVAKFS